MKRIILLCCICVGLVLPAKSVMAGSLLVDANITYIANTLGNQPYFAVYSTTGSGPCVGLWIKFYATTAGDYNAATGTSEMHKRAYANALLAFAGGYKVSIYNYSSDTCDGAAHLSIYK